MGRLKSAREACGDTGAQSWLVNYDYDVFGNRYQKQANNANNPFAPMWVEEGAFNSSTNRFAANVSYDDAGNILTDQKFRQLKFQYDANNRQKQSSNLDDNGAVVSVYDAGGQRVATQIGGSLTNVLVYDAGGKLVAEYGAAVATGGTQYLFSDHQGSPRAITGPGGNVISRHDYAPFGEEIGAIGMRTPTPGYGAGDNARQKYAGMEQDDGTGMSHTMWRQYDNRSGRWTAPDPYGGSMSVASPQSFNRYIYVNNDPINNVDPIGLMLSDIGVYQINDPEEAATTQRHWDAKYQKDINGQYAAARGGTVIYDKDTGEATFIGKHSAVNYFRKNLAGFVSNTFLGEPQKTQTEEHGLTVYQKVNDERGGSYLPPCADDIFRHLGLGQKIKLDDVRIHIGIPDWITDIAQRAGGIVPKAITWGNDIYFRSVDDLDFSKENVVRTLALIGHELTHVLQWHQYGDRFYFRYLRDWADSGFRYGGRLEEDGANVEELLKLSLPKNFGNDPCKDWRH